MINKGLASVKFSNNFSPQLSEQVCMVGNMTTYAHCNHNLQDDDNT